MEIYKEKFSSSSSPIASPLAASSHLFLLIAKYFDIFTVFPTQSKVGRSIKALEIADLEFSGDDTLGRRERSAGYRCGRGAFREVQVR